MFKEAGLSLPFGPLMVDFLWCCKLTPSQLSPNGITIICGIERLNVIHGTSLRLEELQYCYSFRRQAYGFSLKVRNDSPSLVLALPDSHKGFDEDAIILIGDIIPNPMYKLVPRRASGPVGYF